MQLLRARGVRRIDMRREGGMGRTGGSQLHYLGAIRVGFAVDHALQSLAWRHAQPVDVADGRHGRPRVTVSAGSRRGRVGP